MICMLKDRLKLARKASKKTQVEIATAVGMTQSSYSELETGKSQASTLLPKMADILGVDALWLQTGEGEMQPSHLKNSSLKPSTEYEKLMSEMQRMKDDNKLPPEVIAMLRQTLNTIEKVQDKQTEIVAGEAPAIDKQSA